MQSARLALVPITGILMLVTLYLVYFWVPTDVNLGVSQRIFYFHVPIAMLSLIPPVIIFGASVVYLWKKHEGWDALAHSSVEVAILFTTLALVTGSIWAKPTWGVWWTWDPMLTTFFILWLIYVGYLLLRAYAPPGAQGARYAAILGIIGSIDAGVVYFATVLWRTTHPGKVIGPAAESGSLDPSMYIAWALAILTFTLLFIYVLLERFALHRDETQVEQLRDALEDMA